MNRYRNPTANLSLLLENTLNWDLFIYPLLEMRKLTHHFILQLFLGIDILSKGLDWFWNSGLVVTTDKLDTQNEAVLFEGRML